ncbi:MAG: DUF4169 family protein [Rhodobacteraceae bacterium]|jgi:hypothetical protein|nr:DUF4169 family protein [Paracoccaceae bacterium]
MAEIVNLNRFRKAKDKASQKAEADANAVKFGRTKAEKRLEEAQKAQADQRLDGHERDRGEP